MIRNEAICAIGIVASTSGANEKAGRGMLKSAEYALRKNAHKLEKKGIKVRLKVEDDKSVPEESIQCAKSLLRQDCLAIIGPTDSNAFSAVLECTELQEVPILSTIASASFLSRMPADNFFRFTTPDFVRAEILVRHVRRLYPSQAPFVFTLSGSDKSYGRQLRNDVVEALGKYGMYWTEGEFSHTDMNIDLPTGNEPVILCAPSSAVVAFAKCARQAGVRSQFFVFGSNTNLLHEDLLGSVTVCDLDRDDSNLIAREEIEHFLHDNPDSQDPDLSTMNAITVVCRILEAHADSFASSETPAQRFRLLNELSSSTLEGLFGNISFSDSGEMAGHENISVLSVSRGKCGLLFEPLSRSQKPVLSENRRLKRVALTTLTVVGSVASAVSLAYLVLSLLASR